MANFFHFSPCGNTKACAEYVLDGMGESATSVNLLSPEVFQPDPASINVVAFPVFSGHVAPVVFDRLDVALPEGSKVVGVAVYGNRAFENALQEMNDYLVGKGCEVVALVAAVAEHSLCDKIATGRPDAEDAALLTDFGLQVADKLAAGTTETFDFPSQPDIAPYALGVGPITNEECTACGICADECPTQVIVIEDEAISPAQCLSCAHCIVVCPFDAREYPAEAAAMFEQFLTAKASERRTAELFM